MNNKIVVVGMSGGVDSTAAAYILKKDGYSVIGVTLKLIDTDSTTKAINDAREVCNKLNINHYVFDLRKEFKDIIIDDFISNYKKGLTPNPCILCNKKIKFGLFYKLAKERFNADYIATGHYAKIKDNKLYLIKDNPKDQSYFLYGIDKNILPHILFPLSNYKNKDEVRNIVKDILPTISIKKDSEDICFIENNDHNKFLNNYIKTIPGNITLKTGQILGKHNGLYNYTIGQRKGLNISYKEPLYVINIDTSTNTLVVGPEKDLYSNILIATNINLLTDKLVEDCFAKIRSRSKLTPVKVELLDNKLKVIFKEPVRAITKGQSVVLYDSNDVCLGGGIITEAIN